MAQDIDFVLLWVDGNDPAWNREFKKYASSEEGDKSDSRYRDWGNLQYLFRAFEVCVPWVRKIHFVTWGHVPEWLDLDHPKLNVVTHDQFLEKENLPVFNARAIECNLHRIEGLAEHFVFFNDDMFILRRMEPESFFLSGLPRDLFALNLISTDITAHMKINNVKALSRHFIKKNVLIKQFWKWFRLGNGPELIKSLLLLPWPQFTGFYNHHLPQPFLKSTFMKVWSAEGDVLRLTSSSKFRKSSDVNQFLFKWWQILDGEFKPRLFWRSKKVFIWTLEDAYKAKNIIEKASREMLCVNDHIPDSEFDEVKKIIANAFEVRFPAKSAFEL